MKGKKEGRKEDVKRKARKEEEDRGKEEEEEKEEEPPPVPTKAYRVDVALWKTCGIPSEHKQEKAVPNKTSESTRDWGSCKESKW